VVDGEFRETAFNAIDLASVLAGDAAANVVLLPYDYLNIKEITGWREQATVTMRGEFNFPGALPIRQGETLSSAIERAGGLTEFAFPEGSVFTRVELREREVAQLERLARRIESDLASMTLADQGTSDALATGQTLLAQLRNTEPTGRLVIQLDEILAGMERGSVGNDVMLRDGDELFVPELRQEVTVIGEVQYPTSHTYERGLLRDDYIGRSGGLTRRADDKRIYVVRANGEVVADGGVRWFRRDLGVEIRPGDTVVAPLEVDRVRPLTLWSGVTQIIYNMAIAAAAVNSF
jgi:protein involved in polysaccharide export with SLBB domain